MITLQELRDFQPEGNAHSDMAFFRMAHELIIDRSQPLADRLAALAEIDRIMGERPTTITEEDLNEYLHYTEDYLEGEGE